MTSKLDKSLPRQALSQQDISNDISSLLRLPPSSLETLLQLSSDSPAPAPAPLGSAVEELQAFTPAKASPEQSLRLSKAYTADMKVARGWEDGRLEQLGERVDKVRRDGQEIKDALEEVKL